jgi:hypothetical protein
MTPERLLELLNRCRPDGTPCYPREDVVHFLPLLMLLVAPDQVAKLPGQLHNIMFDFVDKLGLPAGATVETFEKAIDDYYRKNPIAPQLRAEFGELLKLKARPGNDTLETGPVAAALQSFTEARHIPVPQRGSLWADGDEKKKE